MAVPYVLLTAFPRLLGRIPKGGNWMILLKHAIGFGMLAFCVYLILLFSPVWHGPLFYFCLLLGFCVWLGLAVVNYATPTKKRLLVRTIALILLIAGSWALAVAVKTEKPGEAAKNWFAQLEDYQQQKRSVIVKFTANWCKNCTVIDKIIYKNPVFKDKLSETRTALVVADWSKEDADIERMLAKFGGKALPFAVVFPGGEPDNPIILRDFYSMEDVINALDKAYGNL
jgi:thiol:disulfide interchange protein DsbD